MKDDWISIRNRSNLAIRMGLLFVKNFYSGDIAKERGHDFYDFLVARYAKLCEPLAAIALEEAAEVAQRHGALKTKKAILSLKKKPCKTIKRAKR